MKAKDSHINIIHWECDENNLGNIENGDLIFDLRLGREPISKEKAILKFKWTYRALDKEEKVIINYIGEDVFKVTRPDLMQEFDLKKIMMQSFFRFNNEYKFRMQRLGQFTILYRLKPGVVSESLALIRSW